MEEHSKSPYFNFNTNNKYLLGRRTIPSCPANVKRDETGEICYIVKEIKPEEEVVSLRDWLNGKF